MATANNYKIISYEELLTAIEKDLPDNNFRTSAGFLINAVTDWPTTDLSEPQDLIVELKKEIKNKLTFDNIKYYQKSLNPEIDAWKLEAVTALIEMFDLERKNVFDRTIELETIVERLSDHYKER